MDGKSKDQQAQRMRAARLVVTREIDENLKRVYQAALEEEVPDRFMQLLAQLRAKEEKS